MQSSTTTITTPISISLTKTKMKISSEKISPGASSRSELVTSNNRCNAQEERSSPIASEESLAITKVKPAQNSEEGPIDLSIKVKFSSSMPHLKETGSNMNNNLKNTSALLSNLQPLVVKPIEPIATLASATSPAKLFQFPPGLPLYSPFGQSIGNHSGGNNHHSSSLSSGSSAYYSSSPSSSSTKSWSTLVDEIETYQQQTSKLTNSSQVSPLSSHSPALPFQFQPHPSHLYRQMMAAAAAVVNNHPNHHHHHHHNLSLLDGSTPFGSNGLVMPSNLHLNEALMHSNGNALHNNNLTMKQQDCHSTGQSSSSSLSTTPVKSNVIKFGGSSTYGNNKEFNSKSNIIGEPSNTIDIKQTSTLHPFSPVKYDKPLQGSFEYYLNQINAGISKPGHLIPSKSITNGNILDNLSPSHGLLSPSVCNSTSSLLAAFNSGQPNRVVPPTPQPTSINYKSQTTVTSSNIPTVPRRRGRPPGSTNKKKRLLLEQQQQQQQLLCAMQNMVPGMLPQLISGNGNNSAVGLDGFDKFAHQKAAFESQMVAFLKINPSLGHGNNHGGRKPRGESRKCRKVYGMSNREQWCTQCKWKKACSRFTD